MALRNIGERKVSRFNNRTVRRSGCSTERAITIRRLCERAFFLCFGYCKLIQFQDRVRLRRRRDRRCRGCIFRGRRPKALRATDPPARRAHDLERFEQQWASLCLRIGHARWGRACGRRSCVLRNKWVALLTRWNGLRDFGKRAGIARMFLVEFDLDGQYRVPISMFYSMG